MERGSGWHGVVLGALLLTTGALGTWRIWDGEIEDEHLALYDHPLQHLVAADQHRVLDDVATAVSWAATPELIPILAAIPWFLRTRRREPLLFAGAVVLASAAVMVLKIPVGRVRRRWPRARSRRPGSTWGITGSRMCAPPWGSRWRCSAR